MCVYLSTRSCHANACHMAVTSSCRLVTGERCWGTMPSTPSGFRNCLRTEPYRILYEYLVPDPSSPRTPEVPVSSRTVTFHIIKWVPPWRCFCGLLLYLPAGSYGTERNDDSIDRDTPSISPQICPTDGLQL